MKVWRGLQPLEFSPYLSFRNIPDKSMRIVLIVGQTYWRFCLKNFQIVKSIVCFIDVFEIYVTEICCRPFNEIHHKFFIILIIKVFDQRWINSQFRFFSQLRQERVNLMCFVLCMRQEGLSRKIRSFSSTYAQKEIKNVESICWIRD